MGWVKNVLPGQTVEIIMQAVNRNLQGVMGDPDPIHHPSAGQRIAEQQPADRKQNAEGRKRKRS